jgi:hypothetical protein
MSSRWSRLIPLAVLAFARPVLAQSDADNAPKHKPTPKAARVPTRPKIPTVVRPTIKHDAEPAATMADRTAPPLPAQDVGELEKSLEGRYRCKGTIANAEGGLRDARAHLKVSSDLDGYWIAFDLDEDKSSADYPLKIHIDRTYSSGARAWQGVMLDNRGNLAETTADRADEQAVTWLGSTHKDGAKVRVRTHEERDDRAGQIRLWNEISADGQAYRIQFDLTCTK